MKPIFFQLVVFAFNFYFLSAVIVTAVLAYAMRFLVFVAMRAFHDGCRRCFVVCKSLIRSALRLFALRYCHITPLVLILSVLLCGLSIVGKFFAIFSARNREWHACHYRVFYGFCQIDNSIRITVIFIIFSRFKVGIQLPFYFGLCFF